MKRESKYSPIEHADALLAAKTTQPQREGDDVTIKNETDWHTGDIARLARRVCDEMGVSRRRTIRVVYARSVSWGSSGYAWYNTRSILMRVPRPPGPKKFIAQGPFPVLDFARVLEHEIQHNLGLAHHAMTGCHGNRKPESWFPWTAGYSVRGPKPRDVKVVDKVARRAELAAAALVRWERKLRLAQSGVRRAKAKVRYYERTEAKRAACKPSDRRAENDKHE